MREASTRRTTRLLYATIRTVGKLCGRIKSGFYFRSDDGFGSDFVVMQFQYENAVRAANHFKRLAEKLSGKLENQKSVLLKVRDELLEARELKKYVT